MESRLTFALSLVLGSIGTFVAGARRFSSCRASLLAAQLSVRPMYQWLPSTQSKRAICLTSGLWCIYT